MESLFLSSHVALGMTIYDVLKIQAFRYMFPPEIPYTAVACCGLQKIFERGLL